MSETSPPKPSKLIVVERSRAAVVLGIVAALAYATILALAFGVIIARQGTIDALRRQVDAERGENECRASLAVNVTTYAHIVEAAQHDLIVEVVRQLSVPIAERDFSRVVAEANRVDVANRNASVRIQTLRDYIDAGSPLPCPVD